SIIAVEIYVSQAGSFGEVLKRFRSSLFLEIFGRSAENPVERTNFSRNDRRISYRSCSYGDILPLLNKVIGAKRIVVEYQRYPNLRLQFDECKNRFRKIQRAQRFRSNDLYRSEGNRATAGD